MEDHVYHHPVAILGSAAYSQEEPATTKGEPGSAQEKATSAKEDDLLPIYKEGWQFFLAPYLWIPGVHLNLSHQGRFSGTTVTDVPWYDLVPLLFSKAFGGMGRVGNPEWQVGGLFRHHICVYRRKHKCRRSQGTKTEP